MTRTDSGIDSHEVAGYVRHNPSGPSAAPSAPTSTTTASAGRHGFEDMIAERVEHARAAARKIQFLRRYRPHVIEPHDRHGQPERWVDADPVKACRMLDELYVVDESHRIARTGPYREAEPDARADAAPNVTGIIATSEVRLDGRVELRTRATLERIAKQIERDHTPVVLGSHADDAPVVGHVALAWVERDGLHADMVVSYAAASAVASGTDGASMRYSYNRRLDADGDVRQEDHQVKHVTLCRRDQARSPETRVRVLTEGES